MFFFKYLFYNIICIYALRGRHNRIMVSVLLTYKLASDQFIYVQNNIYCTLLFLTL